MSSHKAGGVGWAFFMLVQQSVQMQDFHQMTRSFELWKSKEDMGEQHKGTTSKQGRDPYPQARVFVKVEGRKKEGKKEKASRMR